MKPPGSRASCRFLVVRGGYRDVLLNHVKPLKSPAATRTSGLVNIVFCGWFFERQRLFIDRAMVITRPTIPRAHGY